MMPRAIPFSRILMALLCGVFISIPFLMTQYPPITDLPQHSAQIRLFLETLGNPSQSAYKIQWLTPYSVSYAVLGGAWALFGPLNAGRMAMLAIVLLWVGSIHGIAWKRDRSGAAACVASVFALNHVINWGFYSFAIGFPAFCLWFALTSERDSSTKPIVRGLTLLVTAFLLYISHVLWFAAGVLWLGLSGLILRRDVRGSVRDLALLLPLFVAIWFWYPLFSHSSMATPALWVSGPLDRLTFSAICDSALGGIRGPTELIVLGAAFAWIGLGLLQHRTNLVELIDWPLLLAGGMFFTLAVVLPDKYMNTIRFGQRWMPPALIMFVLALPSPAVRPLIRRAAAIALVAIFCIFVSKAWLNFEHTELSGLPQALKALPESPRVVGLAFGNKSDFVKGYPFIQMFAYAQALKGGTLNFSFAEWSPCLVVYKKPFVRPWTRGLEWFPQRVQESDLNYFDYALFMGPDELYTKLAHDPRLAPVTTTGRWRLYRIRARQNDLHPK